MKFQPTRHGAFWIGLVLALFGVHMVAASALVYFAHSDPSFAVVPDYYDKGVAWDETKRRRAASDALGWSVLFIAGPDDGFVQERDLTLTLVDADKKPVEGAQVRASAFHIARSAEPVELTFEPDSPGLYTERKRLLPAGIWEFHIEATRGEQAFTTTLRLELRDGRPASS